MVFLDYNNIILHFLNKIRFFSKNVKNPGYINNTYGIKRCITQILFIHLFNIYESLLGYAGRLFALILDITSSFSSFI